MIIGILMSLLTLALPIAVIVLVVRHAGSGSGSRSGGGDSRSVRRFFQYVLLYGLMVVAVVGVSDLLARLGGPAAESASSDFARVLAFVLFGVPMAAALGWWTRRQLRRDPQERLSFGWAAYLTVASLTALMATMVNAFQVVVAALWESDLDGASLARFGVWALVWGGHWVLGDRLLKESQRQLHLAVGSLIGLMTTIGGLVWLVGTAGKAALVAGGGVPVGPTELSEAAATLAVGFPVWWVYWRLRFSAAPRRGLWLSYVLPIGVGGSLVLAVINATTALHAVLVWFLGDQPASAAALHFADTPYALAAVAVGAVSWWYHRWVFARGAPAGRTEVTRVHEYLLAGIALVAAASGVAVALVAMIRAMTPGVRVLGAASVTDSLLLAATLLVVGGLLWWVFWRRVQRAATASPAAELTSRSRRTYLFLLFGVGGVLAVIAILAAAFVGIQDALNGQLGDRTLSAMRVPLALLVTSGAVSGFHWLVYRRDRAVAPVEAAKGLREVLLVGPADDDLAEAVHRATGARVELWARSGGAWVTDEVLAALAATPGEVLAVIAGPAGLDTFAVEERRRF